jgi:hypothetical protein
MKRFSHYVVVMSLLLLGVSGCKKKPKPLPPTVQAPTISAPLSTAPVEEKTLPAATTPAKPATTPDVAKAKPKPKPKPPAKKPAAPKPAETEKTLPDTTTVAKATPPRIVVQPGPATPTSDAPVVPDMSHTEEAHHRQTTEQLMLSTEANLKSLRRVLNPDERSLLQQVQLFMAQSREASESQDLVRAHNLAMKAHLLSDELVR